MQTKKWIIDLGLFTGFVIAFLMDITGLAFHQWLGILVGAIAAYHLISHWVWVRNVGGRFLDNTSWHSRGLFLLDAVIMIGFITIILSGVVMSTWLNLWLTNYSVWRDVHIIASIDTLLLVVFKISMHGQWILRTMRQMLRKPKPISQAYPFLQQPAAVAVPATNERRDFLKLMGVVGGASVLAMAFALDSRSLAVNAQSTTETDTSATTNSSTSAVSETATQQSTATVQTAVETTVQSTSTPTVTATVVPTNTQAAVVSCTIRCREGCSFPGRCHRYTDSNNNGLCDNGECL
jgi:hypothetical protein